MDDDFTQDLTDRNVEGKEFKKDYIPSDAELKKNPIGSQGGYQSGGNEWKKNYKKKGIDLWNGTVEGAPIEFDKGIASKSFLAAVAAPTTEIDETLKPKIQTVLRKLAMKGYEVRTMCQSSKQLMPIIDDMFDYEKIIVSKPWKKFCDVSGFKNRLPTDDNIRAAAYYVKRFKDLPTAVKYISSAMVNAIFGDDNMHPVEFIIIYDPYIGDDNKIDFKKSINTGNLLLLPYTFKGKEFNIYNLAKKKDIENLLTILD